MNISKNTSIEVFFFYMSYSSDKEMVKYERIINIGADLFAYVDCFYYICINNLK